MSNILQDVGKECGKIKQKRRISEQVKDEIDGKHKQLSRNWLKLQSKMNLTKQSINDTLAFFKITAEVNMFFI